MSIIFPGLKKAEKLKTLKRRLLITAYGFEERSLGWSQFQKDNKAVLENAIIVKYENPKGKNKIAELKKNLKSIGIRNPVDLRYNVLGSDNIETEIENKLENLIPQCEEIVLDITAMTKFLILLFLCKLENFSGTLRIIYSEAENYAPTEIEYNKNKDKIRSVIKFPSRGFGTILRAKCLSSIRMQGQPVSLIAFTSFNEQLVRHMLGTMSPHRLIFINGKPPRPDYKWREKATLNIHKKLMTEYPKDNEISSQGILTRTTSTLEYEETIVCIDEIYEKLSLQDRLIIAATGSKMQTVGLFFSKRKHPDIHIEYPTPDSYYIKGFSEGTRNIYEIIVSNYAAFLINLSE